MHNSREVQTNIMVIQLVIHSMQIIHLNASNVLTCAGGDRQTKNVGTVFVLRPLSI